MITPEGDVRLLDLGLARAMGDESSLTRTNLVVGTLDYASPEQLVNASSADARSDLYSIGCTIYFTLAGRPPFEGGDIVNKIFKQRMEDPQPLENVSRGVPAAFGAIVRKLMAKDPRDRYQSAMELRADLARWTDPERVRSILGAEAETARVFRPAPPEIDDDDLRLVPDDDRGPLSFTLRDLGAAEPAAAPVRRPVPIPVPAVIVPHDERSDEVEEDEPGTPNDDSRWLTQFIAVAVVLGLLAILAIALFV
jgi:serine/threonine-protein kinase